MFRKPLKTVKIDGRAFEVVRVLSCGPGVEPHTYEFTGGYVERFGTRWQLFYRNQPPRPAHVEAA